MSRQAVLVANSGTFAGSRPAITEPILKRTLERLKDGLSELPPSLRFEVRTHVNESPSKILATVQNRARACNGQDLFFFFYIGHGRLSQALELEFIHPSGKDTDSRLPLVRIERLISAEEVRHSLFIIDCCYAGAQRRNFPLSLSGEHCRIAATTPAAHAYVVTRRAEDPLGVFSRAVLDGFYSHEACRSPADNSITADSLFEYAKRRTLEETKGLQQPEKAGHLTQPVAEYRARPHLVTRVAVSDEKTGYQKVLAICRCLASFESEPSLTEFFRSLRAHYKSSFVTLIKEDDGQFTYQPVSDAAIAKYVRFMRRLGLIEEDALRLTTEGRAISSHWKERYSQLLLTATERRLRQDGLSRDDIESALRQVLGTRQVPTRTAIIDYIALRHPYVIREDLGMILDFLGYMQAIRMSPRRAYFPW